MGDLRPAGETSQAGEAAPAPILPMSTTHPASGWTILLTRNNTRAAHRQFACSYSNAIQLGELQHNTCNFALVKIHLRMDIRHLRFYFVYREVQDNTYSVCSDLVDIKCQAVTDSDVRMLLKRRGNRHFLLYPAAVGPCVCVCV